VPAQERDGLLGLLALPRGGHVLQGDERGGGHCGPAARDDPDGGAHDASIQVVAALALVLAAFGLVARGFLAAAGDEVVTGHPPVPGTQP
jgi:hypothetical protein